MDFWFVCVLDLVEIIFYLVISFVWNYFQWFMAYSFLILFRDVIQIYKPIHPSVEFESKTFSKCCLIVCYCFEIKRKKYMVVSVTCEQHRISVTVSCWSKRQCTMYNVQRTTYKSERNKKKMNNLWKCLANVAA